MHDTVPAGREGLDGPALSRLSDLPEDLLVGRPDADLDAWLRGKTVLVTGGTGCIGSTLMTQLDRFGPARLVSVSRGSDMGWPRLKHAEYLRADIRDGSRLGAVVGGGRPGIDRKS